MKQWAVLVVCVATIDAAAIVAFRPTLSEQYAAATAQRPVLLLTTAGWMVAHLAGWLPRHVDPLTVLGDWARARRTAMLVSVGAGILSP